MDCIGVAKSFLEQSKDIKCMCDLISLHLPVTEALTADVPGDQPHALHGPGVRVSAHLRIYVNINTLVTSLSSSSISYK